MGEIISQYSSFDHFEFGNIQPNHTVVRGGHANVERFQERKGQEYILKKISRPPFVLLSRRISDQLLQHRGHVLP